MTRAAVLAAALALSGAASAHAAAPVAPPPEVIASTAAGVLRVEGTTLRLGGGHVLARDVVEPTFASSDRFVAVSTAEGILAGPVGGPLRRVPSGARSVHGCRGWKPSTAAKARSSATPDGRPRAIRAAAFTVLGDRLLLAGVPACAGTTPTTPRPLFSRPLSGGGWTRAGVVAGRGEAGLAARGGWLAVGTQTGATMTVRVFDRDGRRERYHVAGLVPGTPSVDEQGRLLVATGLATADGRVPDPALGWRVRFGITWASASSPVAHVLPVRSSIPPAISAGRIAVLDLDAANAGDLEVVDVVGRSTRKIVGVRGSLRQVVAVTLDGDQLLRLQSRAEPPPRCYGELRGPLRITTTDLATNAPAVPAPPQPPAADPAICGPVPP